MINRISYNLGQLSENKRAALGVTLFFALAAIILFSISMTIKRSELASFTSKITTGLLAFPPLLFIVFLILRKKVPSPPIPVMPSAVVIPSQLVLLKTERVPYNPWQNQNFHHIIDELIPPFLPLSDVAALSLVCTKAKPIIDHSIKLRLPEIFGHLAADYLQRGLARRAMKAFYTNEIYEELTPYLQMRNGKIDRLASFHFLQEIIATPSHPHRTRVIKYLLYEFSFNCKKNCIVTFFHYPLYFHRGKILLEFNDPFPDRTQLGLSFTALSFAVAFGDERNVKLLAGEGINPNVVDPHGQIALYWSVCHEQRSLVQKYQMIFLLLELFPQIIVEAPKPAESLLAKIFASWQQCNEKDHLIITLLRKGADLSRVPQEHISTYLKTLLHREIPLTKWQVEALQLILPRLSRDVYQAVIQEYTYGYSAATLRTAVVSNHKPILALLFADGFCDVSTIDAILELGDPDLIACIQPQIRRFQAILDTK